MGKAPPQIEALGLDFEGRALQVEGAKSLNQEVALGSSAALTTLGPRTGSRGNLSFLHAHFADEAAEALPRVGPRTQSLRTTLLRNVEGRPKGAEMLGAGLGTQQEGDGGGDHGGRCEPGTLPSGIPGAADNRDRATRAGHAGSRAGDMRAVRGCCRVHVLWSRG